MHVAIYARVSSERQDVDLSISAQLKALREYASRNDHTVVKEYIDEAESGRSIDRPGFKQMIATARQKTPPFEAILVWKLSRFARNREDSIIYKSLLRKQGIQVISINEPLEDTPSGRLLEGIIEVIDEFYSANLSQDVVRGMRENASRGFYTGGYTPYGYRRVKVRDGDTERSKLEPDPTTAPVVERIFRECVSGQGLKEIAKGLNRDGLTTRTGKKWGTTSVHNVLRNEAYAGVLVWDRRKKRRIGASDGLPPVRVENAWPAIVHRDTFGQAQAKLADRAPRITHPRVVHSEYILSGMIRCKECGTAMIGHAVKSGKFFYYMCGNARRKGRDLCKTPLLPKDKIERFVIDRIKQYILTEENLEELVRLTNEELAQTCDEERERLELIQAQIADVDSRLGKLYDALETGEFKSGELAPRIKALFAKKEELQQVKAEAEEALRYRTIELADPDVVRAYVKDLKGLLEESEIVEQKAFLKSFVEKIEVGDSEVKVIYTIPMLPDSSPTEAIGVLPFIQNGSPSRIRTYDLAVTVIPGFPQGLDYLFTISPPGLRCRALRGLLVGILIL
ncbi:recombinase family protein [Dehalococcoidia bacterium]|nr:recombinase family protein [Dehalococcoidia bacterium]